MGKRMSILMATIVLGFLLAIPADAADPDLVGWWKFDGDGSDSSGNAYSGTLAGNARFGLGYRGQALVLDGAGDYFTVDGYKGLMSESPVTVTAWVQTTGNGTMVYWGRNAARRRVDFRINAGRLRVEHGGGNLQGNTVLNDGSWHHVALTIEADAVVGYPEVKLYLDGQDDSQNTRDPEEDRFSLIPHGSNVDLTIGRRTPNDDRYFPGLIDDLRLYSRVLGAEEIGDVMRLGYLGTARNPSPADGSIFEENWATLQWNAGETAVSHDLYFGTSFEDVNASAPETFVGNLTEAAQVVGFPTFPAPEGLVPGTTYYWRVDEINSEHPDSPWRGPVWSFRVPPTTAYNPVPADGEPFEFPDVNLAWTPGLKAVMSTVYFGADANAVANDTGAAPRLDTTFDPGNLGLGTTYYWRVDTFNGKEWINGPVWSFTTLPEIPLNANPNLVAWWNLDEGAGSNVLDWSGHGHHGDFVGNMQWAAGYDGGALEFIGAADEHVDIPGYEGVLGTQDRTTTAWIKTTGLGDILSWGQNVDTQKWILRIQDNNGNPGTLRVEVAGGRICGWTDVRDGEWHHVAAVLESAGAPTVEDIRLYLDGRQEPISDSLVIDINTVGGRNVWIGDGHHNRPFPGGIDDVRIYDKALSQEELDLVMRIDPLLAWGPQPRNGSIADLRTATPLTWTEGDGAVQHDVYFGTDATAVAAADTADGTGLYRGRMVATEYTPDENLAWGQKYFWRVDEINGDGNITTGRLWAFTVAPYLIVDDFESYNDLEGMGTRIYETWVDGYTNGKSGSTVGNLIAPFAERTIVNSGSQAMPLDYNNVNPPYFSEAERMWDQAQNWTFADVNTLVVHFRGQPPAFVETAADALTLSAAGADIWNTADEFRYAFKRLTGDGSIIARVDNITNTNVWAKGGVMIRETLDPGSRHASVFVTPGSGVAFQRRLANSDVSIGTTEAGIVAPHWVKLTRTGDTLTAQHSADGVTWSDVLHATNPTSDTVVMGGTIYIGVALTSHASGVACTAEFSGIKFTGNVTGSWQQAEIGVDHPGNSSQGLYVAVEDSTGKTAVVTNPDPLAATVAEWTEWQIPLSNFVGINPARVKKMYIGVGDRNNPVPDGAGRIYIDDIRLIKP